jgi:hypothetical protein
VISFNRRNCEMETIERAGVETQEAAVERVLRAGRPATVADELYGPGPESDDPEDLEAFLALLDSRSRPAQPPGEEEA